MFFYDRKLYCRPQLSVLFFHSLRNKEKLKQAWYLLIDRLGGFSSVPRIVHLGPFGPPARRPSYGWRINIPCCWPYLRSLVAMYGVWAENVAPSDALHGLFNMVCNPTLVRNRAVNTAEYKVLTPPLSPDSSHCRTHVLQPRWR